MSDVNGLPYTIAFSAVAITAAQDLFEILTPSTTRIQLLDIDIGQYSDFGDAQAELISIQLIRGHGTTGSGGSAVTPVKWYPWSRASGCTCAANNTTVATTGSPETILSTSFNVAAGFVYRPPLDPKERLYVDVSTRLVLRISAPVDSLTVNGTLKFKEIGKAGP